MGRKRRLNVPLSSQVAARLGGSEEDGKLTFPE